MTMKAKYPIGSQWECRDGTRAVVVGYEEGYRNPIKVYLSGKEQLWYYNSNGKTEDDFQDTSGIQLLRPWKEKRVFEDEIIVCEKNDCVKFFLKSDIGGDEENYGWKWIARKPIKITEGDGLD